jgi:hypothetical protein
MDKSKLGSDAEAPERYRDRPSDDGKHGDAAEEQSEGAWSEGRDRETKKPAQPRPS